MAMIREHWLICLLLFGAGLAAGHWAGSHRAKLEERAYWILRLVDEGHGRYDSKTGKFELNPVIQVQPGMLPPGFPKT